jgi:hypothetical protein
MVCDLGGGTVVSTGEAKRVSLYLIHEFPGYHDIRGAKKDTVPEVERNWHWSRWSIPFPPRTLRLTKVRWQMRRHLRRPQSLQNPAEEIRYCFHLTGSAARRTGQPFHGRIRAEEEGLQHEDSEQAAIPALPSHAELGRHS